MMWLVNNPQGSETSKSNSYFAGIVKISFQKFKNYFETNLSFTLRRHF